MTVCAGQAAPDFELANQDGVRVRLSDFRGRNVILFAFPKAHDFSFGCNAQACGFNDELPQFEAGNAVVLGISGDSIADLKKWHTSRKLTYDLLSNTDHKVIETYGAWGIPILGFVDVPMVKRSYWVIDERGIIRDMQVNVGPGESVRKALAALERLKAMQSATP